MEELTFDRTESRIDDVTWNYKMKSDLLACHAEALEDFNSDDPPRYLCSGNIVGMKQLLIRKWEEIGYQHLQLTAQDLQDMVWKIKYNDNEVSDTAKEELRKVLDEFEKGNDVHISEVVTLINELNEEDQNRFEEIKAKIAKKIQLKDGSDHLTFMNFMKYLSNEFYIGTDDEIIKAFKVFDKDNKGTIPLKDLKTILTDHGLGFDEEEVKLIEECSRKYEVEISQVAKNSAPEVDQKVKKKEEKGSVLKKNKETKEEKEQRKAAKKLRKTKLKEEKKVAKQNKLINNDTDKSSEETEYEVDYNAFVKGLMEKIKNQESNLWAK